MYSKMVLVILRASQIWAVDNMFFHKDIVKGVRERNEKKITPFSKL